jgi:hypothetical protein
MTRKTTETTALLLLALLVLVTLAAAPAAFAQATFVDYTASEMFLAPPNITSATTCGSVVKVTMANHLLDFDASHPWGNADVFTQSSWVIHTVDGQWTESTFIGTYRTESPTGTTAGWFTGSMSWLTGVMDYRLCGKGKSGDVAGTIWTGIAHCPGYGDPITQMTMRVLTP